MTTLTLQLPCVVDCEEAVERPYYEWGRGRPVYSPEPHWDTAPTEQRWQIALRGYGAWDGLPAQYSNRIGALEVYTSTSIDLRLVLSDMARSCCSTTVPEATEHKHARCKLVTTPEVWAYLGVEQQGMQDPGRWTREHTDRGDFYLDATPSSYWTSSSCPYGRGCDRCSEGRDATSDSEAPPRPRPRRLRARS